MALSDALSAVDKLKDIEAGSLNADEKQKLTNIKKEDIRKEKEKIGQKTFKVNGSDLPLKEIAGKVKDGMTINRGSEIGAALQVYAIANGQNLIIDGKVGEQTKKALRSIDDTDVPGEQLDLEDVYNKNMRQYVDKYCSPEEASYLKKYKIFDLGNGGKFVKAVKDGEGIKIHYYSELSTKGEASTTIKLTDIQLDNLNIDAKKLAKQLYENVRANEERKTVKKQINYFRLQDIQGDEVLSKRFSQWPNVKHFNYNKTVTVGGVKCAEISVASTGNWKDRQVPYKDILNEKGEYEYGRFVKRLRKTYRSQAVPYVRGELRKQLENKEYDGVIDAIKSYQSIYPNDFNDLLGLAKEGKDYEDRVNSIG